MMLLHGHRLLHHVHLVLEVQARVALVHAAAPLVGVVGRGMRRRGAHPVVRLRLLLLLMVVVLGVDCERPLRVVPHSATPLAVGGPQVGVTESELSFRGDCREFNDKEFSGQYMNE